MGSVAKKRKPERFPMRVQKGCFVPADRSTQERLRERGFKAGDLVFMEIRKPRNPRFHRLAHALGQLCAENIEAFDGMEAHRVLKRLQIEAGVGCDNMGIIIPGIGKCLHVLPRSLSFESMSEDEFYEVVRGFCRHIAANYWPTLTSEQVEEMAGVMIND
jgi:hypothetical protein